VENPTLTAVPGLAVGHWTDLDARTGCTVVLAPEEGCTASALVLGGSPAARETELLAPDKLVPKISGLVLSGGSVFGLATADGVVTWLKECGRGFPTRAGPVPIVPAACIYDLEVAAAWPGAGAGYAAAAQASATRVPLGRVGAGIGATASSYLGYDQAVPGGLGSAAVSLEGITLAALTVSNPAGDIYDPKTGALVVGHGLAPERVALSLRGYKPLQNTTLVIVATDASLTKAEARMLCTSAHVGIARVTRPSHTPYDGDIAFVLSTGDKPAIPIGILAVMIQEVVAEAILQGVRAAQRA
jgi:L-aminopeptidase/D-esterase-like protein